MTYAERIETARNERHLANCSSMKVETIKLMKRIADIEKRFEEVKNSSIEERN